MREYHFVGGMGVRVNGPRIAANAVEETVHLGLGVVEASGTAPAIGAPEDCFISVVRADPFQFLGDELKRCLPANLDVGISPPGRAGPGTVFQPPLAYRRAPDTGAVAEDSHIVLPNMGGVRVLLNPFGVDHFVVFGRDPVASPVA